MSLTDMRRRGAVHSLQVFERAANLTELNGRKINVSVRTCCVHAVNDMQVKCKTSTENASPQVNE